MTSATLVLVHGTCASPAAWGRVVPLLDELGVSNVVVQLPSCLPESEMNDASMLVSVLNECADPVVLAGHSAGGTLITEAGNHPSVTHLVYVDAVMFDAGESIVDPGLFAEEFVACIRWDEDATSFDPAALTAYLLRRGWSVEDTHEFVSGLRPQRHAASVFGPTVAAWRTVPSTFISCIDSEMKQELFASRATDVIEMPGDHFPHWLRPNEVADVLARIAHDVVTP